MGVNNKMSREVKFRAWGIDRGKMHDVYNIAFHESYGYKAITNEQPLNVNTTFMNKEEFILMQYTGLKDKNGVEIYEGDIVQIKGHAFQKKPGDFTGIEIDGFYPVTYTERMELVAGQWLLMHQLPYITVVGNIYEHPHLLERD